MYTGDPDPRECFILTTVVRLWAPIAWLASPRRDEIFNLSDPGFTSAELLDTLSSLFSAGELVARPNDRRRGDGDLFTPTRNEIEEALADRIKLYYGLTTQGGERWEAVARPRWDMYLSRTVSTNPHCGEIIGSSRRLVENYLGYWRYSWPRFAIIPESVTWQVLRPWQATYWKSVPVGYRVTFQWQRVEPEFSDPPPEFYEFRREIERWYTFPAMNERSSNRRQES